MSFETFAIVELFGHQRIAGKATEVTVVGVAMLRVDVPKTSRCDAYTKYYSAGAIYAITPTDEATATAAAENLNLPPVDPWVARLPTSPLLSAKTTIPEDDWDEDSGDPDDYEFGQPRDLKPDHAARKKEAAAWAKRVLELDTVFLDFVVAGDMFSQVSIVDKDGKVLLAHDDSEPVNADEEDAAKNRQEIIKKLFCKQVDGHQGKVTVIQRHSVDLDRIKSDQNPYLYINEQSLSIEYAGFRGEWEGDLFSGEYKRHSLNEACQLERIMLPRLHGELETTRQARAMLALVKHMAAWTPEPETDDIPF